MGEAARVAARVLDGRSATRARLPPLRLTGRCRGGCPERARAPRRSGSFPLRANSARQRSTRAGQGHRSARCLRTNLPRARSARLLPLPVDAGSPTSGLSAPGGRARGSARLRPSRGRVGHPYARLRHMARRGRVAAGIARSPGRGPWAGARGARALPGFRGTRPARHFAARARPRRTGRDRDRVARASPSPSSSSRRGDSSTRSRCSSWGRRPAAPADAPTRARRSERRSSWPMRAAPTRLLRAPTRSSSPRVRAHAEIRPKAAAPSPPQSCASHEWPPKG